MVGCSGGRARQDVAQSILSDRLLPFLSPKASAFSSSSYVLFNKTLAGGTPTILTYLASKLGFNCLIV